MDWKPEFPDHGSRAWLNTAHQGVLPLAAARAANAAVEWKLQPWLMTQERFDEVPRRVRSGVAALIGAEADDVVLANGASHGQHLWADGLDLKAGDRVLLMSGDFPSTRLPWLNLQRQGVEVVDVASVDPVPSVSEVEAAITPKTRVLAMSWVHSFSGLRADLRNIGELCQKHGIHFLVNTTQGVGAVEFDVGRLPVDGITNAGWKWLCGPYATGFCWMRPEFRERLNCRRAYWLAFQRASDLARGGDPDPERNVGARRFDLFAPANFFAFNAWTESLELVGRVGVDRIRAHDVGLVRRLLSGLDPELYQPLLTSEEQGRGRHEAPSSIVVLEPLRAAADVVAQRLASGGVDVAVRAGRVRLSPHLYNTDQQIELAVSLLNEVPTLNDGPGASSA